MPERSDTLIALLESAGTAHHVYETQALKGIDPDWYSWYAEWLIDNGINTLLGANLTTPDLRKRLVIADDTYNELDDHSDWPTFYATYLRQTTV